MELSYAILSFSYQSACKTMIRSYFADVHVNKKAIVFSVSNFYIKEQNVEIGLKHDLSKDKI